jgi:hypothetical protein
MSRNYLVMTGPGFVLLPSLERSLQKLSRRDRERVQKDDRTKPDRHHKMRLFSTAAESLLGNNAGATRPCRATCVGGRPGSPRHGTGSWRESASDRPRWRTPLPPPGESRQLYPQINPRRAASSSSRQSQLGLPRVADARRVFAP